MDGVKEFLNFKRYKSKMLISVMYTTNPTAKLKNNGPEHDKGVPK